MAMSTALAEISGKYIPAIAAGGFVDYATGDWLKLLAKEMYAIDFNPATFTTGNITLTTASGSGPYVSGAGSLIAVFAATGNRYINSNACTIPASGSLTTSFKAEFAGASYHDPSNSGSISLVTALPGVTLVNSAGTFSAVSHVGSGTGTLTVGGSPSIPHQIYIQIDATGESGDAYWSASKDGSPFVSQGHVSSVSNLLSTAISITLTNGATGTASFVLGDIYSFSTPGTWITAQGADEETSSPASTGSLATRCRDRWSSLSPIPTNNFYDLLAKSTPSVGSQVTQVLIIQDSVINNKVNIGVAGPEGPLPNAVVAAIQSYVDLRVPITDLPFVVTPSTTNVTLAGTITVANAQLATAQTAIGVAMSNYIAAVGINGTVRLSKITELIMEVSGVLDISSLTVNAAASNLTLGSSTTFYLASLQALGFNYVTY